MYKCAYLTVLFQNCYFVGPDIAFNKPAYSSSAFGDNKASYGPQYVNNGKADCSDPSGPIAHTNHEHNPWYKVDLRGTFNIKTVAVLPRKSKFLYYNLNLIIDRLSIIKGHLELVYSCTECLSQFIMLKTLIYKLSNANRPNAHL